MHLHVLADASDVQGKSLLCEKVEVADVGNAVYTVYLPPLGIFLGRLFLATLTDSQLTRFEKADGGPQSDSRIKNK